MGPDIEIEVEQIARDLEDLDALIEDAWGPQIDPDDVQHAGQLLTEVRDRYQTLVDRLDGDDRTRVEQSVGMELRRLAELHGRMQ
ncbi:MAG: hypothetical protein GWO16_09815 [Gammaproteobacteria bacterium]|nr:hypothetical protein [Gammaproteobacteria bacterium]NIR98260.1 hypothetical protein [Gammaproteobacteria bacterium]NIT63935.1 hypothetical protein [Gammaproteobacteria bacterium]NIV20933.1 hypothetical protein [Gammaproteobacteria bacterium]NIX10225.1 hypothetical protein [Gammaproteobacteria bacterium]